MTNQIEIEPLQHAAELEAKFETLGEAHLALDAPSLLERAGKLNHKDPAALKAREDRVQQRREIEAAAADVIAEHVELCKRDQAICPLDRVDTFQVSALRSRLRERRMAAGRFRVLLGLSSGKVAADLRRRKLAEVEVEIARLATLIQKLEGTAEVRQ